MHHHTASHDPVLVALSILIAALASYTALDLATRMRAAASGRASSGWLAAAAIAMGGGIWSMHFVGMLAFSLPGIEVSYDPFRTLLSLVIPIVVAAAAFAVVGRRPRALVASGFVMGLAISGMHYAAMEGASFVPAVSIAEHAEHFWVGQAPLAFLIAGTTIIILTIGLTAAVYDRASAERAER